MRPATGGLPDVPVGDAAERTFDWLNRNLEPFFDAVRDVMGFLVGGLTDALLAVPTLLAVALFALLALVVRSWRFALVTLLAFSLLVSMGMWAPAMQTLALVLVATLTAVLLSVPVGILAARNDAVSTVVRPVLDFMQTMPAFVYLVPAVTLFSIGVVPGVFATIIFALPPGVRLTELGIRQVDRETVEAGEAFGSTPGQILRGIQLPLALPTIMAGVNQVIMLALSMAVIAGLVGAGGLGQLVVSSISTLNLGLGFEAGLSVVVLAIYLDRLTAAVGRPSASSTSLRDLLRRRRARGRQRAAAPADGAGPDDPAPASPPQPTATGSRGGTV